jgi:hypothetical protein
MTKKEIKQKKLEIQNFICDLKQFQAKAGCIHSQQQAEVLWRKIKPFLTEEEEKELRLDWGHHVYVGEGRHALDWDCNAIIKKRQIELENLCV